jgi:hypothetical protein
MPGRSEPHLLGLRGFRLTGPGRFRRPPTSVASRSSWTSASIPSLEPSSWVNRYRCEDLWQQAHVDQENQSQANSLVAHHF